MAAMGYVSERAYACMAQDADDPSAIRSRHGAVSADDESESRARHPGPADSLDGLIVGVRLTTPALKVVQQPHHAQFVIYSVPDDVAAAFDCESRLTPGGAKKARAPYGNYFGVDVLRQRPRGSARGAAVGPRKRLLEDRVVERPASTTPRAAVAARRPSRVTRMKADARFAQRGAGLPARPG